MSNDVLEVVQKSQEQNRTTQATRKVTLLIAIDTKRNEAISGQHHNTSKNLIHDNAHRFEENSMQE